jgi:hypothetical protein
VGLEPSASPLLGEHFTTEIPTPDPASLSANVVKAKYRIIT